MVKALFLAASLFLLPASEKAQISEELTALPAWYQDGETQEERKSRMDLFADVQVDVANEFVTDGKFNGTALQLTVGLMSVGFFESRYAKHVHAGQCKKDECDRGRAKSVYQVQDNNLVPTEVWSRIEGLDYDSTRLATYVAAVSFANAWNKCGGERHLGRVYSAYARGHCDSYYLSAATRASWFERKIAKLR